MLRRLLPLLALLPVLAGCGGTEFAGVPDDDVLHGGAQIFNERCAGCHSFSAASAEGSPRRANSREYKDGPNFNERSESVEDVLYAIQNGGFSSGPMPQDIVVGEEARKVAEFVAEYSGGEVSSPQRTDMP